MARRILLWLLVAAFIWLLIARRAEIAGLLLTLAGGRWQFILIAAVLQLVYYTAFGGIYQAAFATVDVESRLREIVPVTFASIFVNTIAPVGGTGGMALFVDDAARRGQPPGRAAGGILLAFVCYSTAFMIILGIGLVVLRQLGVLQVYEVVGAIILLISDGVQASLLLMPRAALLRVLHVVERAANRIGGWFRKPALIPARWPAETAAQFAEAAIAIKKRPAGVARTLVISLIAHLLNLVSLMMLFFAFDQRIGIGSLIAAYAMALLFSIVAITPSGVGVAEGVIVLVLTSLGIPAGMATVISLTYRGLTFWLPVLIGFVLLRRTKSFQSKPPAPADVVSV